MLIRLAAAILDTAEVLRHPERVLRLAWLSLPGDLVARGVLAACGIPAAARREISGAVPGLPAVPAIVVEDPRSARYLDHVPIRPTAQTIGRYIVARGPLSDAILRHEVEHVRQWTALGPLFLPSYLLASGVALLRGGDRYRDNAFEVAARAAEAGIEPRWASPADGGDAS